MKMNYDRKPKLGLLAIAAKRFMPLGDGTANGTYEARKQQELKAYMDRFGAFADIVCPGVVSDPAGADAAARLFFEKEVDGVVALFLSWAEDAAWIHFLRELPPMPLLLVSVVRDSLNITDTHDENQFVEFLSAGSLVGHQVASGSFRRFDRPLSEQAIGTLNSVADQVAVFARAARTRSVLRRSTVGLMGSYNEAMWATYVDPYNLFMKIGPELHFLSVQELTHAISTGSDEKARAVCDELAGRYTLHPSVDPDLFAASVKASLALEQIALRAGIDLLVLNDIDPVLLNHVGLRPGFLPTSPDVPLVVTPEGDLGGGLAVYILQALTGRIAHFIEPFYIDHTRGVFVAGHAGPCNFHVAPEQVIIARDERFAQSSYRYAGAPFAWCVYPPGETTLLHMSELDGRMKMVATTVETLPTKHYLASYSHAELRPTNLRPEELFARTAECGVTQHYGIVPGNCLDELEKLASLCGFAWTRI